MATEPHKETLDSISERLTRIENSLERIEKHKHTEKEERDMKDIIWLVVIGGVVIYLFISGGFGALWAWVSAKFLGI